MSKIELPRYLHKRGEESKLVIDEIGYDAAIADGWSVSNQFEDAPVTEPDTEPVTEPDDEAPKKRGRPKKAE